jgi:hypothetical protein
MKQYFVVALLLALIASLPTSAQLRTSKQRFNYNTKQNLPDSTLSAFCFGLQGSFQLPLFDLQNRFGYSKSAGILLFYKTNKNFCWGITSEYFFGSKVKEQNLFKNISSTNGAIITEEGDLAEIKLYERGFIIGPKFGYISKLVSTNKNSGISFWLSPVFIQHKISIKGDELLQLQTDYKKGYDRLSAGWGVQPGIFYHHMAKNHLINYKVGFDGLISFTNGKRTINFDTGKSGLEKRLDGLIAFKFSWFIPKFIHTSKQDFTY